MARKADEGWVSRNGKPVHIPPYKAPRQKTNKGKTTKGKDKTSVRAVVLEVVDSEDKGKEVMESDSEEDTQLGLVWGSPVVPEKALQDSDVEGDQIPFSELKEKRKADKEQTIECVGKVRKEFVYPYVFVPETEEQASAIVTEATVVIEEVPSGEKCVGHKIVKEFADGLFKGTVMTAIKKRGRFLYHVVYEDGDEEDLNDQEFREGYELLFHANNDALKTLGVDNDQDEKDNDNDKSGGETEGSEYDMSEDDEGKRKRKKRRTKPNKLSKEKAKKMGENNKSKEEDKPKRRNNTKASAVDIQALINSGGKKSVTNQTIASMTTEEQATIIGTAEKTILKEAKKGLRKEAMKVSDFNYLFENL